MSTNDRRDFLKGTGLGLAGAAAWGLAQAAPGPNDRLAIGFIGCGGMGKNHIRYFLPDKDVELTYVCDPDEARAAAAAKIIADGRGKAPKVVKDLRQVLDDKSVDAVVVATPDHWHGPATILACEAGKHVYVEKPCSHNIREGRLMIEAARKHGRVVQVGTQRRSTPHLVEAREKIVKAGLLGKVGYAEVCCYYHMRANGNPPVQPVPEFLDYEMWTGPAPLRPYDGLPHKRWWRTFMEYGNGIMGDMCIHMLDMVRWMLDLGWPQKISSTGGILVQTGGKSNIADTQAATFDFGDLKVTWQHRTWGNPPDPDYPWAGFLYGEKGTLKLSVHRYDFIPTGKKEPTLSGKAVFDPPDKYPEDQTEEDMELHAATANRAHQRDFLHAVIHRTRPVADIEQGHISTASCILANLSMQLGRTLTWDAQRQQVVDDPEANRLLRRSYRAPWVHPEP